MHCTTCVQGSLADHIDADIKHAFFCKRVYDHGCIEGSLADYIDADIEHSFFGPLVHSYRRVKRRLSDNVNGSLPDLHFGPLVYGVARCEGCVANGVDGFFKHILIVPVRHCLHSTEHLSAPFGVNLQHDKRRWKNHARTTKKKQPWRVSERVSDMLCGMAQHGEPVEKDRYKRCYVLSV